MWTQFTQLAPLECVMLGEGGGGGGRRPVSMRARFFQKVQADKGARTVGIFQIRIFVLFKTACLHGLSARVARRKWQTVCERSTIGESGLSFPVPSLFLCLVPLSLPYHPLANRRLLFRRSAKKISCSRRTSGSKL